LLDDPDGFCFYHIFQFFDESGAAQIFEAVVLLKDQVKGLGVVDADIEAEIFLGDVLMDPGLLDGHAVNGFQSRPNPIEFTIITKGKSRIPATVKIRNGQIGRRK